MLYYGVWCALHGGASGTRHCWLKSPDGEFRRFDNHVAAEREAARLTKAMNGPNAEYTAAVLGDTEVGDQF